MKRLSARPRNGQRQSSGRITSRSAARLDETSNRVLGAPVGPPAAPPAGDAPFRQPFDEILLGKTTGPIGQGSTGEVTLYSGAKGSETASTTTVPAYNRFGSLQDDSWCLIAAFDSGYEIIAANPCTLT